MQLSDTVLEAGTRIALCVEYCGRDYHGWQRQSGTGLTVQGVLEAALSEIAHADIIVACAGRTDARVHATGQVVSFESASPRSLKAWYLGTNSILPRTIRVRWAEAVPSDFHARFSALSRRYRYIWHTAPTPSTSLLGQVTWLRDHLDITAMNTAAQALVGEQDFSAFQAASCQSPTPFRNVSSVSVSQAGQFTVLDITANAFLHHMVRNIAGSLAEVGKQAQQVDWIRDLLLGRDRTQAAATAVSDGLYLVEVAYPDHYGLPRVDSGPAFLPSESHT